MAQQEAEARTERLHEATDFARDEDSTDSGSQDSSVGALGSMAPLIVIGLDGSPTSWDAFSWAAGEAIRSHGSLVAVYVTPEVEPVATYGASLGYAAVEEARDEVADQLREEVQQRARELGLQLKFIRERGETAPTITRVARSLGADLIVVGRSAKMLHHLAGSLGRRLVSRSDVPVIAVVP
jgi:nucleotide-binding universal stress UspA family protein